MQDATEDLKQGAEEMDWEPAQYRHMLDQKKNMSVRRLGSALKNQSSFNRTPKSDFLSITNCLVLYRAAEFKALRFVND